MQEYKVLIRTDFPRLYSQDLLNNLFRHPYTKIEFLQSDLGVTRQAASKYLNQIAAHPARILSRAKVGRDYFFVNTSLMSLFSDYDYKL